MVPFEPVTPIFDMPPLFDYVIAMHCPTCQAALPDQARFCPNCGAPVAQATTVGGYTEPQPEIDNPKEPMALGDLTIRIEGELVPVVDVELGRRQHVYFEHHI
jgi:zinc-ribbon domain